MFCGEFRRCIPDTGTKSICGCSQRPVCFAKRREALMKSNCSHSRIQEISSLIVDRES